MALLLSIIGGHTAIQHLKQMSNAKKPIIIVIANAFEKWQKAILLTNLTTLVLSPAKKKS